MLVLTQSDELQHHGILGQKWGQQNGPPYPLKGGDYSKLENEKIKKARKSKNSIYNKKHYDTVLNADKTTLHTLSYDKDRTKDTDMFFAATNAWDKHQYNAMFNQPMPKDIKDENGKSIGNGFYCKYAINNKLASNVKVASEDSGARILGDLFKKNRDFYNFLTDKDRMQSYFVDSKYKFRGYREARDALDKARNDAGSLDESDIRKIYRMFNYVIPFDGRGNARAAKDIATQRARFFAAAKQAGYGALLDTNDAIYGGMKTRQPVIMFDMDVVVPDKVRQTVITEKYISSVVTAFNYMSVRK